MTSTRKTILHYLTPASAPVSVGGGGGGNIGRKEEEEEPEP